MLALNILLEEWPVVLALVGTFVVGLVVALLLFVLDKERALRVVDALDRRRQSLIQLLHRLLLQPRGIMKALAFIFAVNLFGASLFQHTIGGLLIVPPFIFLFTGGLLIGLLVQRYPERRVITAVVAPFEFGAFVVAATGGIGIGSQLWSGGDVAAAVQEWAILFVTWSSHFNSSMRSPKRFWRIDYLLFRIERGHPGRRMTAGKRL
jgi:hypothetical protein